ncbi:unnamed protein product [Phytophthora fragariaefolia]|uniref:Unnamed protein product n=1 Tax=Phytophthora fragariaefolia TaxID=1490495 RepID=A0A9W6XCK9_9STRA|nr:unnamed protein product [Phytophthora fragariaefolia]
MTEIPELWGPLPIKPAPGSADSSLSWPHSSDDDEDDDKFNTTYHAKTTPSSGSSSTRSQPGASGKRPRDLGSSGKGSATEVAKNFVSEFSQSRYAITDPDFDYYRTPQLQATPELADMYRDRKDRHADFDSYRKKLVDEVEKTPGYSDRIWFEPGFLMIPQNPCYWITRDPKLQISLQDQLATVDDLEPARTQWVTRRSEDAFLKLTPDPFRNQLLSDVEQLETYSPRIPSRIRALWWPCWLRSARRRGSKFQSFSMSFS